MWACFNKAVHSLDGYTNWDILVIVVGIGVYMCIGFTCRFRSGRTLLSTIHHNGKEFINCIK